MNLGKKMLITLLLFAILTFGAVSASDDIDALAVDDTGDEQVVDASADDAEVNQINEAEVDSIVDASADDAEVNQINEAEVDPVVDASADNAEINKIADTSTDDNKIASAGEVSDDALKSDKYDDFHVVFTKEVSIKDTDATVVSFDWPDWVPQMAGVVTVKVIGSSTYTQRGKFSNTNGIITLDELGITSTGDYSILFTYGDDEYSTLGKLKVSENGPKPTAKITGNKDINMLYTSNAKYKVRVTLDGKAVANKYVTFKFNGQTKKVKTDSKGYATYKIPKVAPKNAKYTITATYNGVKVSNKIKVNGIVVAKNLKVKKSKKVTKVKVTLKKVNKKYLTSKKITLKFKGKTYKANTNKKGVAIFKIKKNVFKKLKVGKKYKYTVTYGKNTVSKMFIIGK